MRRFLVESIYGRPVAILEAQDRTDATLYAAHEMSDGVRWSKLRDYDDVETRETRHSENLTESFQEMGLSESGAKIAAEGRAPRSGRLIPTIQVPKGGRSPTSSSRESSTAKVKPEPREVDLRESLTESFTEITGSKELAEVAVTGRGQ